jgi:hypothetical protein
MIQHNRSCFQVTAGSGIVIDSASSNGISQLILAKDGNIAGGKKS